MINHLIFRGPLGVALEQAPVFADKCSLQNLTQEPMEIHSITVHRQDGRELGRLDKDSYVFPMTLLPNDFIDIEYFGRFKDLTVE